MKKLLTMMALAAGISLVTLPAIAGGPHGRGYGREAGGYYQQQGTQDHQAGGYMFGDGTEPRPQDGTGFGFKWGLQNSNDTATDAISEAILQ